MPLQANFKMGILKTLNHSFAYASKDRVNMQRLRSRPLVLSVAAGRSLLKNAHLNEFDKHNDVFGDNYQKI